MEKILKSILSPAVVVAIALSSVNFFCNAMEVTPSPSPNDSIEVPNKGLPADMPTRSCCVIPCPPPCPKPNPCVPECLISGCFKVADVYPCPDFAQVIDQTGCNFFVTPLGDGKYLVSLIEPICKPLIVTASKNNTFQSDDVSNVVTVLSDPTSPTDSFVLGNIQCGDFVCFHAIPVVSN